MEQKNSIALRSDPEKNETNQKTKLIKAAVINIATLAIQQDGDDICSLLYKASEIASIGLAAEKAGSSSFKKIDSSASKIFSTDSMPESLTAEETFIQFSQRLERMLDAPLQEAVAAEIANKNSIETLIYIMQQYISFIKNSLDQNVVIEKTELRCHIYRLLKRLYFKISQNSEVKCSSQLFNTMRLLDIYLLSVKAHDLNSEFYTVMSRTYGTPARPLYQKFSQIINITLFIDHFAAALIELFTGKQACFTNELLNEKLLELRASRYFSIFNARGVVDLVPKIQQCNLYDNLRMILFTLLFGRSKNGKTLLGIAQDFAALKQLLESNLRKDEIEYLKKDE